MKKIGLNKKKKKKKKKNAERKKKKIGKIEKGDAVQELLKQLFIQIYCPKLISCQWKKQNMFSFV